MELRMNTLLKLTAIATLAMASNIASAVNVGGVIFDPDYVFAGPPSNSDFDADTASTQWYVSNANAGTVNPTNALIPSGVLPDGTTLQGVGEFGFMNGLGINTSSVTGGDAASFCPGCELTYVFNGIEVAGGGALLVGGTVDIYVDNTADFNPGAISVAAAQDGVLWLSLAVEQIAFTADGSNGFLKGFVSILLNVLATGDVLVDGLAAQSLDTNGQPDGSDLVYSASANFLNGSSAAPYGNGTADLKGNSIPVPGTLLLIGLGILGFGVARRKRA
jgi:hypothetical protein